MGSVYDTGRIREAAHKVKLLSARMDADVAAYIKRALSETEELRGITAECLEESCSLLLRELKQTSYALEEMSDRLYGYADDLEEADERLASEMR